MSKPSIELPEKACFTYCYRVQLSDTNHAQELAAAGVLPIIENALQAFLENVGIDPESSKVGMMMASSQVDYISESNIDDLLEIDIFVVEVDNKSFDFYYLLKTANTDIEVARVKARMLFFDYLMRKVTDIPENFSRGIAGLR